MSTDVQYGFQATIDAPFDQTVEKVKDALQAEGFGILTEIDMQATFKAKLDAEIGQYLILGACNPALAHQAMQSEQAIGLLLPCNVIVYETESASTTQVAMLDPSMMVQMTGNDALEAVAKEAENRLQRALQAL